MLMSNEKDLEEATRFIGTERDGIRSSRLWLAVRNVHCDLTWLTHPTLKNLRKLCVEVYGKEVGPEVELRRADSSEWDLTIHAGAYDSFYCTGRTRKSAIRGAMAFLLFGNPVIPDRLIG